jgi:hypothetical protein
MSCQTPLGPGGTRLCSLHILEWRTGGFVEIDVRVTDAIDVRRHTSR